MSDQILTMLTTVLLVFEFPMGLGVDEPDVNAVSLPKLRLKIRTAGGSAVSLQRGNDGSYEYICS